MILPQRIYITRRTDSNPRSSYKKSTHPTSPCLLCTERQVVLSSGTAEQAGRGWVSGLFVRQSRVAVRSTSDIYIFFDLTPQFDAHCRA